MDFLDKFIETFDIKSSHADNTTRCIQECLLVESERLQKEDEILSKIYYKLAKLFGNELENIEPEGIRWLIVETNILRFLLTDIIEIAQSCKPEYSEQIRKYFDKTEKEGFKVKTNPLNTLKLPDPLKRQRLD